MDTRFLPHNTHLEKPEVFIKSERSDTDKIKATGENSWHTDHTPAFGFVTHGPYRVIGAETGAIERRMAYRRSGRKKIRGHSLKGLN